MSDRQPVRVWSAEDPQPPKNQAPEVVKINRVPYPPQPKPQPAPQPPQPKPVFSTPTAQRSQPQGSGDIQGGIARWMHKQVEVDLIDASTVKGEVTRAFSDSFMIRNKDGCERLVMKHAVLTVWLSEPAAAA